MKGLKNIIINNNYGGVLPAVQIIGKRGKK